MHTKRRPEGKRRSMALVWCVPGRGGAGWVMAQVHDCIRASSQAAARPSQGSCLKRPLTKALEAVAGARARDRRPKDAHVVRQAVSKLLQRRQLFLQAAPALCMVQGSGARCRRWGHRGGMRPSRAGAGRQAGGQRRQDGSTGAADSHLAASSTQTMSCCRSRRAGQHANISPRLP